MNVIIIKCYRPHFLHARNICQQHTWFWHQRTMLHYIRTLSLINGCVQLLPLRRWNNFIKSWLLRCCVVCKTPNINVNNTPETLKPENRISILAPETCTSNTRNVHVSQRHKSQQKQNVNICLTRHLGWQEKIGRKSLNIALCVFLPIQSFGSVFTPIIKHTVFNHWVNKYLTKCSGQ